MAPPAGSHELRPRRFAIQTAVASLPHQHANKKDQSVWSGASSQDPRATLTPASARSLRECLARRDEAQFREIAAEGSRFLPVCTRRKHLEDAQEPGWLHAQT